MTAVFLGGCESAFPNKTALTFVLGGGSFEFPSSSGSSRPINQHGSGLLHQPSLLVQSAPSSPGAPRRGRNVLNSVRSKKKSGEPGVRRGRGAPAGAAGPHAGGGLVGNAAESRPSALSPLTGLRRDPRASAAFPQRCGSVVDAAPPVFGGASCWRRNSLQPRWKPQTAARASWSARTHEAGFVSFCAVSYVFLE